MYVVISQLGRATVKELSKLANIDRGEVYRLVGKLQEKGLIEKIITSPIEYRAVSFKIGIDLLLQERKNELSLIEKNALKLAQTFHPEGKIQSQQENISYMSSSEPFLSKMIDKMINTQTTLDIASPLARRTSGPCPFSPALEKALKNRVKIRVLFEKTASDSAEYQKLTKYPLLSTRVTNSEIEAPIAIHDGTEAWIFTSDNMSYTRAASLFVSNMRLVGIIQKYFDNLWGNSREINLKQA